MYNKNIESENLTNEELCVCEDFSITASERAAIDRVIEMYENGKLTKDDFVEWREVKESMRKLF